MKTSNMIVPNLLLGMAGGIQYRALVRATKNPRKASEKTLREILTYAKDTVYGKEHKFSYILEAQDDTELYRRYREQVKPNEYEDFRPYVDCQQKLYQRIADPSEMGRLSIMNTAESGFFAADRAIAQYASEIWHIN